MMLNQIKQEFLRQYLYCRYTGLIYCILIKYQRSFHEN